MILAEWAEGTEKVDVNWLSPRANRYPLLCALESTVGKKGALDDKNRVVFPETCTDLKYEVVEYLLSIGAHVNVPESILPAATTLQQFGLFGGGQVRLPITR